MITATEGGSAMATRDQDVTHGTDAEAGVLVREGSYGTQVMPSSRAARSSSR